MNWQLLLQIAMPLLTLVLGAVITSALERRARLIAYATNVSSFRIKPAEGDDSFINAHSLGISDLTHHQPVAV